MCPPAQVAFFEPTKFPFRDGGAGWHGFLATPPPWSSHSRSSSKKRVLDRLLVFAASHWPTTYNWGGSGTYSIDPSIYHPLYTAATVTRAQSQKSSCFQQRRPRRETRYTDVLRGLCSYLPFLKQTDRKALCRSFAIPKIEPSKRSLCSRAHCKSRHSCRNPTLVCRSAILTTNAVLQCINSPIPPFIDMPRTPRSSPKSRRSVASEIAVSYPESNPFKWESPPWNLSPRSRDHECAEDTPAFIAAALEQAGRNGINPLWSWYGHNPLLVYEERILYGDFPLDSYQGSPPPLPRAELQHPIEFLEQLNPHGVSYIYKVRVGQDIRLLKVVSLSPFTPRIIVLPFSAVS